MGESEPTKFCTKCGNKYFPTDNYCQECGSPINVRNPGIGEMLKNDLIGSFAERRRKYAASRRIALIMTVILLAFLAMLYIDMVGF